ncbi:MAG: PQQ-binding-like beta-propeller repeat protein, partial [Anaerolineales bacterium]|nr:PQQ-binding-like beta-propeller repeat protein [Anaerolineales bacterium]
DCLYQPPFAAGQVMLVRTGDGRQSGLLYGLDVADGGVLWQYETARTVASNVAYNGDLAYFLNARAELVAVDAVTGAVREVMGFMPASLADAANRSFQVAAAGDLVFVYFGDSRQLFAFRVVN